MTVDVDYIVQNVIQSKNEVIKNVGVSVKTNKNISKGDYVWNPSLYAREYNKNEKLISILIFVIAWKCFWLFSNYMRRWDGKYINQFFW